LLKYSPEVELLWQQSFGAGGFDTLCNLSLGIHGVAYVTGESLQPSTDYDVLTAAFNAEGTLLWQDLVHGEGDFDRGRAIAAHPAGGAVVCGSIRRLPWNEDVITIRYDSTGNRMWTRTFEVSTGSYDVGKVIAVDADGNTLVGGGTSAFGGGLDYLVLKYDPDGNLLWQAHYDGLGGLHDTPADVATDALGNVVVTGSSDGSDGFGDVVTLKLATGLGMSRDDFESGDASAWLRSE